MARRQLVWHCVIAGGDLSFLSELRPELPGEKRGGGGTQRMQSCHLISAYRHYLFKAPSDTLAGARILREEGKQGERKCGKVPGGLWEIQCASARSC